MFSKKFDINIIGIKCINSVFQINCLEIIEFRAQDRSFFNDRK